MANEYLLEKYHYFVLSRDQRGGGVLLEKREDPAGIDGGDIFFSVERKRDDQSFQNLRDRVYGDDARNGNSPLYQTPIIEVHYDTLARIREQGSM